MSLLWLKLRENVLWIHMSAFLIISEYFALTLHFARNICPIESAAFKKLFIFNIQSFSIGYQAMNIF